jgi:VDE lipocalin domain
MMKSTGRLLLLAPLAVVAFVAPEASKARRGCIWQTESTDLYARRFLRPINEDEDQRERHDKQQSTTQASSHLVTYAWSAVLAAGLIFGGGIPQNVHAAANTPSATEATTTTTTSYSGFADYAKDNKMQQSDVGCFITKCGDQTKALFSNPRGIKGTTCLGRCKGEQACATRCFSEFGSEDLNNWLSCAIEENECVKIPKAAFDNSAEDTGYTSTVQNFDPATMVGKWYKTNGLNPNYDMFDCQYNTFEAATPDSSELDMGIFLRVQRPEEAGGGYWENYLTEHMVVDAMPGGGSGSKQRPGDRTMHTQGKMNGLQFDENWFILGESDGSKGIPPFKLIAYKGHTLQGGYEGSFVYSREPKLPEAAIPAVREAAERAGLKWEDYRQIDNTW